MVFWVAPDWLYICGFRKVNGLHGTLDTRQCEVVLPNQEQLQGHIVYTEGFDRPFTLQP